MRGAKDTCSAKYIAKKRLREQKRKGIPGQNLFKE